MGFQGDPRVCRLDCESTTKGLVLYSCPNIQSLLSTAAHSQIISSELRDAALQYLESKELQERLAKLQKPADEKAYSKLVKDVTKHDHDEDREYFSSYKNSLGLSVHIPSTVFTWYMFGYAIFRSQLPDTPSMHTVGGVLGLIVGMSMEMLLFITRASLAEKSSEMQAKATLKARASSATKFNRAFSSLV